MGDRVLQCFAEGQHGDWEAICLDLDIAVQGSSFDEVRQCLKEAIELYLEEVSTLPEADRSRLLWRRAAPSWVRLKHMFTLVVAAVRSFTANSGFHRYSQPVHQMAQAA
jgi:hypothetical protein